MSASDTEHKTAIAEKLFRQYDVEGKGELSAVQLQILHETLRMGGISLAQVKASMEYSCLLGDCCELSELFDVLQEMDRRYFLLQDLRWEFALLDREQQDVISEAEARFLFEVVHGNLFSIRRWEKFIKSRPVPGTGVSFAEIEVDLCNIPSREAIALEQLEEQREKEERERMYKEKRIAEELRRREFEEEKKRLEEEKKEKEREEKERKTEEEERLKQEKEEEQRKLEEEEKGKLEAQEREEKERREKEMAEKEAERLRELEIIEVQQALEAQRELERKAIALKEEERKEDEKNKNAEEEAATKKPDDRDFTDHLKRELISGTQEVETEQKKIEERALALAEDEKAEAENSADAEIEAETKKPDDRDFVDHLKRELISETEKVEAEQKKIEERALALAEDEKAEAENSADAEIEAEKAAALEKEAEEEALKAKEALKLANNADERRAAEEAEKAARERAKREKNERIRKELKVAIKKKDKELIQKCVKEFKAAKLADNEGDLKKAETILKRFKARDDLEKAMEIRTLESLEKAIDVVKKNGFEPYMPQEMAAANKMLLSLKRLKRLRDEILNLKQSTVAEIRSYSKPPPQVHKVMTATYLLLGNKESELKDWKKMQALIGKTGKDGLKRRVMERNPNQIKLETAKKVKSILSEFDLEQVRDVSAGAAVFFAWSSATEEDVIEREKQKAEGITPSEIKGGHKTIKTEIASGSLTITI